MRVPSEDEVAELGPHADPSGEPRVLIGPRTPYNAVAISRDGTRIVAAGNDNVIYAWSGLAGVRLADIGRHPGKVSSLQISLDGRRALTRAYSGLEMIEGAISRTGIPFGSNIRVWDLDLRRLVDTYDDAESQIEPVFGAPDGRRVYFLDDAGGLFIWDVGQGQPRRFEAKAVDEGADSLEISSFSHASDDGTRVIGGGSVPVGDDKRRRYSKIWDIPAGRVRAVDLLSDSGAKGIAFSSPDARFEVRLEAGDSKPRGSDFFPRFLTTIDLQTGRVVRRFETPPGSMIYVHLVSLSPDNTRFAVGSEGRGMHPEVFLWLWNVRDGSLLASYRCPQKSVPQAVAWLDDGRLRVVSKAKQRVSTPNGQNYEESLLIWETGPA